MVANLIVEAEADEGGAPRELRREHGVGGGGGEPRELAAEQKSTTAGARHPSSCGRRARRAARRRGSRRSAAADAVEVDEHDLDGRASAIVRLDVDVRPAVGPQRLQCAEELSVDGVAGSARPTLSWLVSTSGRPRSR